MDLNDELDEEVVAEAFGKIHPEVLLAAEFVALRKITSGRNVLVHRDLTGCLLARFSIPSSRIRACRRRTSQIT